MMSLHDQLPTKDSICNRKTFQDGDGAEQLLQSHLRKHLHIQIVSPAESSTQNGYLELQFHIQIVSRAESSTQNGHLGLIGIIIGREIEGIESHYTESKCPITTENWERVLIDAWSELGKVTIVHIAKQLRAWMLQ